MNCVRHPEREAVFYCAKYNRYLCEECGRCQDPTLYCKHRTACLVWEFTRHGSPERPPAEMEAQEGK